MDVFRNEVYIKQEITKEDPLTDTPGSIASYHRSLCSNEIKQELQLQAHDKNETLVLPTYQIFIVTNNVEHFGIKSELPVSKNDEVKTTNKRKKSFECQLCDKKISRRFHLRQHMKTHTGQKLFECELCKKKFAQKCSLNRHIKSHAQKTALEYKDELSSSFHLHSDEIKQELELLQTQDVDETALINLSEPVLHGKSEILQETVNVNLEEGLTNEEVQSKEDIVTKFLLKTDFDCEICNKKFSKLYHLREHTRTHTGEKPFKCDKCKKEFSQKSNLQRHIQTHTGEKRFQCTICSNKFSEKKSLNLHVRIHTGEKPFECGICKNRFLENKALQQHVMRVHTGEKPFACKMCKYKCFRNHDLQKHMVIHSTEKPYACKTCNYRCSRKRSLQLHMRIHTGEKPYKCKTCMYRTSRNDDLHRHVKRMHYKNS